MRNLDQEVNYINPYKVINTNPALIEEKGDFLKRNLWEEVKELPTKKKKVILKVCKTLTILSVSFLMLGNPTFAATTQTGVDAITHQDIVQIGLYLIGILAIASTVMASILAMLSGNLKMLRKGKEATDWLTDILKGYAITLVAPVVIITIALLAYLLFGGFGEWFQKPF